MLLNHDLTVAMALLQVSAILLEEDSISCLLPPLLCFCLTEESLWCLKSNDLWGACAYLMDNTETISLLILAQMIGAAQLMLGMSDKIKGSYCMLCYQWLDRQPKEGTWDSVHACEWATNKGMCFIVRFVLCVAKSMWYILIFHDTFHAIQYRSLRTISHTFS